MKEYNESKIFMKEMFGAKPYAVAEIYGGEKYPDIRGEVDFYPIGNGVLVVSVLHNLPNTKTNFFGFHIHENSECSGDFSSAGPHFGAGEHPTHQGDMPVILSNDGDAFLSFFTRRFTLSEIVGRTVIVHLDPDDFSTQPSGNSGERIACGKIEKRD